MTSASVSMAGGNIFSDAVGLLKEIDDSAFSPYLEVQVLSSSTLTP